MHRVNLVTASGCMRQYFENNALSLNCVWDRRCCVSCSSLFLCTDRRDSGMLFCFLDFKRLLCVCLTLLFLLLLLDLCELFILHKRMRKNTLQNRVTHNHGCEIRKSFSTENQISLIPYPDYRSQVLAFTLYLIILLYLKACAYTH